MDCRKALVEANGDFAKAKALLLERGAAQAEKKAERVGQRRARRQLHSCRRQDRRARRGQLARPTSSRATRSSRELTRDIAMHVAAMSPQYLDRASGPEPTSSPRRATSSRKAVPAGKPPEVAEKIVEGKLNKWYEEHVLLDQPFVKDDAITVGDLINAVGRRRWARRSRSAASRSSHSERTNALGRRDPSTAASC